MNPYRLEMGIRSIHLMVTMFILVAEYKGMAMWKPRLEGYEEPAYQPHPDPTEPIGGNMGEYTIGVHDVNGSCTEGHIDWRSPYGAIRVSLLIRPREPQQRQIRIPFESCFIVSTFQTTVKIFLDDGFSDLKPLMVLNSSHSQMPKELCFTSEGDPVILYIESELDSKSAAFGLVQMDYDNRRLPVSHQSSDVMEECRPCTDEEILEAVCTSDFVLKSTMDQVAHNLQLEETSIHININKVYRQRNNMFKDATEPSSYQMSQTRRYPGLKFHTKNGVLQWPADKATTHPPLSLSQATKQSKGVLLAPHKCGIRRGRGEFLFIGRIRLRKARLQCAPRLEDFSSLWQRAVSSGNNMCLLS